ncbi:uncharacterized protein H6S33_007865 [Morchella sextelata]|uniref:uncharacterized protein n=1 Tax=Morchella sextelata TaxID=1174677 RepID=UPI001D042173|nr:uncharacterized protein H6S33_007865 [Morchella sextelata]KAH0603543.1 hypothetical protein H6S33_007865 [Morchella sextelata]
MVKYRFNMCNQRAVVVSFKHSPKKNTLNPPSPAKAAASRRVASRMKGSPLWRFEQLLENRHKLTILGILHECAGVIEDYIYKNDTPRGKRKREESWPPFGRTTKIVESAEEFRRILFKGVLIIYVQMIIAEWKQKVSPAIAEMTDSSIVLAFVFYAAGDVLMMCLGRWVRFYFVKLLKQTVDDFAKGFNNPSAPFFNTFIFRATVTVLAIHMFHGKFEPVDWCYFLYNQGPDYIYWYYRNTIFAVGWLFGKKLMGHVLGALDAFL